MSIEVKCKICGKSPEELVEYKSIAEAEGYETATKACMAEEGTFNRATGAFYCSSCYIKIGMPLGTA